MADEKKSESKNAGTLKVREPDPTDTAAQDRALQAYKVTGIVGDYVDPQKDQEPDIGAAYGVSPHPELQNVAPSKENEGKPGLGVSVETKFANRGGPAVKNTKPDKDEDTAGPALEAGRPDFRGDVNATPAGAPTPVVVVEDKTKSKSDK